MSERSVRALAASAAPGAPATPATVATPAKLAAPTPTVDVAIDPRRTLLRDTAVDLGRRWFASWRADLVREGRVVEGGFPGRLAEARALVAGAIGPAFAKRRLSAVTDEELGWAVHATYDEAKRAWLTSR